MPSSKPLPSLLPLPLLVLLLPSCSATASATRPWGEAASEASSSACGGTRLVKPGRPVVVTSPGYPNDHARRQRCSWRLQPSGPGDVITLVCTDVDLAGFRLGLRLGDFLRVQTVGQTRLLQRRDALHCADVPFQLRARPGESMYLRFGSDGMFQRRGFSCQASVAPRSGSRTKQLGGCGVSFVSEPGINITVSSTRPPPPATSPASPAPVSSETSTPNPSTSPTMASHTTSSERPTPDNQTSTPPPQTPSPSVPAAVKLFTWYRVSNSRPSTDALRPKKISVSVHGEPVPLRAARSPLPRPSGSSAEGSWLSEHRRSADHTRVWSGGHTEPLLHRGRVGRQQQDQTELSRLPPRAADLRVVGGDEVTPHAYPWAAFLVLTVQGDPGYVCGATVISRRYLLTAAHCVHRANSATALLGYHSLKEPGPHSVQVPAVEAVVHPGWSNRLVKHDIALLRLNREVEYSVAVRPICLPTREQMAETFAGKQATVLGWGGVGGGGDSGGRLRAAQVPLMANCRCQMAWPAVVTPLKLCASGRQGTSSCGGDSGGALQVTSGDPGQGHAVLVGVVSWGSAFGCDRGRPSGYTRVTPYLDWIEQHSDVAIDPF